MTHEYLHRELGDTRFGRKLESRNCVAMGAVLALILALNFKVAAQVTTADIVGTVTDPSGASIAGASVSVKNEATGITRTTQSRENGDYTVTLLQVGTYAVNVEAKGFKSFVSRVTLAAGDRARVDASLRLGSAGETVEVQATTPALQSDSSTVGTLITSQATQDLPLNGRNVVDLVELSAGVTSGLSNALSSGTRPR